MTNYTKKETDAFGNVRYFNDKEQYHRLDGPAIEGGGGSKRWYVDGQLHRLDGPAIEWNNGSKEWYVDGKAHRLDGPAVEYASGGKEWWVDDKPLTEEQFNKHPLVAEKMINRLIGKALGG